MAPFRFWRSLWEKVFLLGWILQNGTFQAFCCDVTLKYWFSACVSHLKGGSVDKSVQGITLQTGRLKPWRCTTPLFLTQNIHLSSPRLVVIKRLETLKRCKPVTARLQRLWKTTTRGRCQLQCCIIEGWPNNPCRLAHERRILWHSETF